MTCDAQWGVCPQSSSLAVTFTVKVVLRPPAFRVVGAIMPLFAAPGVPLSPPVYSVPALEDNLMPLAMVNCPMRKIPFAFSIAGKGALYVRSLGRHGLKHQLLLSGAR
jgi:hypothetical protein